MSYENLDYTNNDYTEIIKLLFVGTLSGIKDGIEAANQAYPGIFSLSVDQGIDFEITETVHQEPTCVNTVTRFHLDI